MNKAKNPTSKHYALWNEFEVIDVLKTVLSKDEYIVWKDRLLNDTNFISNVTSLGRSRVALANKL